MIMEYTGRHTTVTPNLKAQAQTAMERIGRVTGCTQAHVILTEDKYRTIAEVTLQCRNGSIVAKCATANDMERALHDALMKLEAQAVKQKDRAASMRARGGDIRTLAAVA
ncbi:MAG: ribosome-associated translation inhibitor RaiA [Acidobacteriaceae bacterium]|nr:ribosome-associated translation inhibitor RaiA [Acidobacteriaceae bacterium]